MIVSMFSIIHIAISKLKRYALFSEKNTSMERGSTSVLGKNKALQYIPRNMHTVFALLCFVMVIHWLIFPYPSGLLHWHCGNLTIAPVTAKQPWLVWINTSCEFIMNDCITTTKQTTTRPCAYFLGYTVWKRRVQQWLAKIKHYLRRDNKANIVKVLSYYEILRYLQIHMHKEN